MLTASYETYVSFYERVWAEAAVKNPMQKPLFDLILSVLGELRTLLPKMAAEADSFIQMIEVTEFDEALDRLDRELAHRAEKSGEVAHRCAHRQPPHCSPRTCARPCC